MSEKNKATVKDLLSTEGIDVQDVAMHKLNNETKIAEQISDLGIARRFYEAYKDIIKKINGEGNYRFWNGKYFRYDDDGTRLSNCIDDFIHKDGQQWVEKCETLWIKEAVVIKKRYVNLMMSNGFKGLVSRIKDFHGWTRHNYSFDANPDLINLENGVLDLTTFELLPHDPKYLMTKICDASYYPETDYSEWEEFLMTISSGSTDMVRALKQRIGLSLLGKRVEEKIYFLYGLGANGKSVFLNALNHMFGSDLEDYYSSYQYTLRAQTVLSGNDNESDADLVGLRGARIAGVTEIPSTAKFNTALLKTIVGSDQIKARQKYAKAGMGFKTSASMWLVGNHKPVVRDQDTGFWRRLEMHGFNHTFSTSMSAAAIHEKMAGMADMVLACGIDGLKDYYENGYYINPEASEVTQEFKNDSDQMAEFMAGHCKLGCDVDPLDPDMEGEPFRITHRDLYNAFRRYAEDAGWTWIPKSSQFKNWMMERGYKIVRPGNIITYVGIALK